MRYLLALFALTAPATASAMHAEFDYSVHLSVCGRLEKGSQEEVCFSGGPGSVTGTKKVELEDLGGCRGSRCDDLRILAGGFEENFSISNSEVKEPYEVKLTVLPSAWLEKDRPTSYKLEVHLRPANGAESEDRLSYVSLRDPAGFESSLVSGVERSVPGTKANAVRVSPYVYVSNLRILPD